MKNKKTPKASPSKKRAKGLEGRRFSGGKGGEVRGGSRGVRGEGNKALRGERFAGEKVLVLGSGALKIGEAG